MLAKVHPAPHRPHVLNSQQFTEFEDENARLETMEKEAQCAIAKLEKALAELRNNESSLISTAANRYTMFAEIFYQKEGIQKQIEEQNTKLTEVQQTKEFSENAHLFSLDGVLKKAESCGYAMATQPASVQLIMKEYQRMSLQFM